MKENTNPDNTEYKDMVLKLMKSGEIMMNEWTNKQKDILIVLAYLSEQVAKLFKDCVTRYPLHSAKQNYEIVHMALGLFGEVGELSDALKKWIIYRKELDNKNIIEEFGDICFYFIALIELQTKTSHCNELNNIGTNINILANMLNVDMNDAEYKNKLKLFERYKNFEYSDKQAHERNDKK